MPWIDSLDWSNLNALRKYPIREGLSCTSADGNFTIPDALIVDFTLSASSDVSKRFYISKIFNRLTSLVIEISDQLGTIVGTFEAAASTHEQDKDYYLNASASYVGANGKITLGDLAVLGSQPAGIFTFYIDTTEFEPRTIIPGVQGIDRIAFIDFQNGTSTVTGDVTIASRRNLQFFYEGNKTVLDASGDLGLNVQCAQSLCVKSINGVTPDPVTGNISLLGASCVDVTSSMQYTLDFSDTCCTPCSGCDDLEKLTSKLTSLENNFLSLKNSYNDVNAQLITYLTTVNANCACPS